MSRDGSFLMPCPFQSHREQKMAPFTIQHVWSLLLVASPITLILFILSLSPYFDGLEVALIGLKH